MGTGPTVAVNVTDWPNRRGRIGAESVTVRAGRRRGAPEPPEPEPLPALVTVRLVGVAICEETKLVSPEYDAVSASSAAEANVVVQVASPPVRSTAAQPLMSCPLLWKSTVPPSGTGPTVAVNVTDWPTVTEDGTGVASVTAVSVGVEPPEPPNPRS